MSSTMVSVLSPHWGGRLRRSKRGQQATAGNSQEAPGAPAVSPANTVHEQFLRFQATYRGETGGSMDGSQAHERVPSLGNRGNNTLGWSSKSGPPSLNLDYCTRRPFYVGLGELDNRDIKGSYSNREGSTLPLYSPLSLTGLHTHGRMSQASCQEELSPSGSTTTGGIPLSLRRLNYNWRNSGQAAELSPASLKNNEQERLKFLPYSLPTSDKTTESSALITPHSSSHSQTHRPNAALSSASPNSEHSQGTCISCTTPQATTTYPAPSFPSTQTSLTSGLADPERENECAETTTNPVSETSVSHRLSQYERYAFMKSQALPRGTTLRSTSWWKRVTQEGSRSFRLRDTTSETTSTPSVTASIENSDRAEKRLGRQIPENLDDNNNNRTALVYKDNLNIASKIQRKANTMAQVDDRDTAARDSDWSRRPINGSNLNNTERKNMHSLPGVSFSSKIGSTACSLRASHDICPLSLDSSEFTDQVFDSHDKYPPSNSGQNTSKKCNPRSANPQSSPPTSSSKPRSLSYRDGVASVSQQATSPHSPPAPTSRVPATTSLPQSPTLFPKPHYSLISSSGHTNVTSSSITATPSTALSNCPASTIIQPPDPSPLSTPVFTAHPASITVSYGLTSLTSPTLNSNRSSETCHHPQQRGKTFTSRLVFSPEKTGPQETEGRKVIRVTWQDSVDSQKQSEANKVQDSEAPAPARPLFPSRPPRSPGAPFSFLRSHSSNNVTSKTSTLQAWKEGNRPLSLASDSVGQVPRGGGGDIGCPSRYSSDSGERVSLGLASSEEGAIQSRSADSKYHRYLSYSASPTGTEARNIAEERLQKTSPPPKPQTNSTISLHPDSLTNRTSTISELTPSSSDSPQILSLPFQNETGMRPMRERLKVVGAQTDQLNNNDGELDSGNSYEPVISTKPHLPGADKAHNSPSTCIHVVETLVYRISSSDTAAAVDNATPRLLTPHLLSAHKVAEETEVNRRPLSTTQTNEVIGHESCSTENRQPPTPGANPRDSNTMTDAVLCQNNSLLGSRIEIPPFQSPKKGLFKGKKRDNVDSSTHKSTLGNNPESKFTPEKNRPETERGQNKGSNKMDQVLSRLRQTFRTRRFEDDLLSSWRGKRTSPTPSDDSPSSNGEASGTATTGDNVLKEDREREALEPERNNSETEMRHIFLKKSPVTNPVQQNKDVFTQKQMSENKSQASSMSYKPERHQLFYKSDGADSETTNEFVHRDVSATWQHPWNPSRSATLPTRGARISTASPGSGSPYSPISSLSSSLSPFTPSDDTDDSVFYSPSLKKESVSAGFKLGAEYGSVVPGRARASTGTSSEGLHQNLDPWASYSSCADLKYGILAGRSVSVSSVLSSRPSGPGRISTGPKGDYCRMSSVPSEPGQMPSRSLPRCFTRSLSSWSPEVSVSTPTTTNTRPHHALWGAGKMATPHYAWDKGGSLTESPSPPWSPSTSRMSVPPSPSSPSSPSSPISPQDIESVRSHLPSKGFISCLTSFEESSGDSSTSDSTTDDEYYLEPEEEDEKETEL